MFNRQTVQQRIKCNPDQYPYTLEKRFPHVLKNIVERWNTPEAQRYFAHLLHPHAGRFDRAGFPEEAWNEILQLQVLYIKQNRDRASKSNATDAAPALRSAA